MNKFVNFTQLSLKDLLEARDLFHAHLINKKNVVATAVGRYLIRVSDFDAQGNYKPGENKAPRTLQNSRVTNISWPCILVFVDLWETETELIRKNGSDIVPKTIYMPDGRTVPVCVVYAEKDESSAPVLDLDKVRFPTNYIGGGFPLMVSSQGQAHIATVGCIVSDGHTYYALTNNHVSGPEGEVIYSRFGKEETVIGKSSGKFLNKIAFNKLYPGWIAQNTQICCDAGLVRIDDIRKWKSDILGLEQTGELYDLNTYNLTLSLIAEHKVAGGKAEKADNGNVVAYGAGSGLMEGEVACLFYRYKSSGGIEYVSDFMIAGRNGKNLNNAHGNSGCIFMLETPGQSGKVQYQPLCLHWGQHVFYNNSEKNSYNFSLSTSLSNVLRELDVELVNGWNTATDYSWGKFGHYKIAALACDIVSDPKLQRLLKANKENISFSDDDMINGELRNVKWESDFVPLADVPDIIWRMTRKTDESNHFADMDEKDPAVIGGRTLLEYCSDPSKIDIDVWNSYYEQMEAIHPDKNANKRGALPFRVWQAYRAMVEALKAGKLDEFIMIGGTAAHYLGDACQPLHVSYLHHGHAGKPEEEKVHSVYETNMLDKYIGPLTTGVNQKLSAAQTYQHYNGGKAAAETIIKMMGSIIQNILSPEEIISVYNETSKGRIDNMWNKLGTRTIDCVAAGSYNLALFWESAWAEGNGSTKFSEDQLVEIPRAQLKKLYNDKTKFPSYRLNDPMFKGAL